LLPVLIDSIVDFFSSNIGVIIEAGILLITSLITALPQIITKIVSAIPQIISSLVQSLTSSDSVGKLIQAGVDLLISLITNLPTIIVEVVKAIPQIIAALVKGFMDSVGKIAQVGLDLIKGLWQGISDAGAWLWEKISGFFGGIVDRIKNFFGIKSPSTLFAGIGKSNAEGFVMGMGNALDAAHDELQSKLSFDAGEIKSTLAPMSELMGSGSSSRESRELLDALRDLTKALNERRGDSGISIGSLTFSSNSEEGKALKKLEQALSIRYRAGMAYV